MTKGFLRCNDELSRLLTSDDGQRERGEERERGERKAESFEVAAGEASRRKPGAEQSYESSLGFAKVVYGLCGMDGSRSFRSFA